jgi:hypothetical protein
MQNEGEPVLQIIFGSGEKIRALKNLFKLL